MIHGRSKWLAGLLVLSVCGGALAQGSLPSSNQIGSLLVYPKVEVRWTKDMQLKQDTFLTLCNTANFDVDVELFIFERVICFDYDNSFTLTRNQPIYWSALTGKPRGLSPWTIFGDPHPANDGTTDLVLHGYAVVFAIDRNYAQVKWNYLHGSATIVDYINGSAWEYGAVAFRVLKDVKDGEPVGTPGTLQLDGQNYQAGFKKLFMEFFGSGAFAYTKNYGGDPNKLPDDFVYHDSDLTLLVLRSDFTQDVNCPVYRSKARFLFTNYNEITISEQTHCILQWDQQLLSRLGGSFLVKNLQTDFGRASIIGEKSTKCPDSTDESLLGVLAKYLHFWEDRKFVNTGYAGNNIVGDGAMNSTITYDVPSSPPEAINEFGVRSVKLAPARADLD